MYGQTMAALQALVAVMPAVDDAGLLNKIKEDPDLLGHAQLRFWVCSGLPAREGNVRAPPCARVHFPLPVWVFDTCNAPMQLQRYGGCGSAVRHDARDQRVERGRRRDAARGNEPPALCVIPHDAGHAAR